MQAHQFSLVSKWKTEGYQGLTTRGLVETSETQPDSNIHGAATGGLITWFYVSSHGRRSVGSELIHPTDVSWAQTMFQALF